MTSSRTIRFFVCLATALLASLPSVLPQAHAQYQAGSSTEAVADPPVPRPTTTPCVVNLFTNQEFADFNNKPFTFTPPAPCPGPYAKIVLTGDYNITAGVQFDRTSQVFLNGVNIFFGTTPEPINVTNPWHFETDLTDYTALFASTGSGFASLGNVVNSTYTGVIYGTMNVLFYPADTRNPRSQPPADVAIPLMTAQGGTASLNASTPEVDTTVTLPTNLKGLYIDVVAEAQNAEEQWFTCLPADATAFSIDGCPNGPFREVEIKIDGVPAGVAPVSPWIYTGGLDPYLWLPIPGNQTLNFRPYRVDLSPFAGVVSDGQPHNIGVELFNAYQYFNVTASLLGYEDHGSTHTTGAILSNTLAEPAPTSAENINQASNGDLYGTITTTSNRAYAIIGTVNTSLGKLTNGVSEDINFVSDSYVYNGAAQFEQSINQTSSVNSTSSVAQANGPPQYTTRQWIFPIVLKLDEIVNSDGSLTQTTTSAQNWSVTYSPAGGSGGGPFPGPVAPPDGYFAINSVNATDALFIVPCTGGYCLSGNGFQASSQVYNEYDSNGYCYYQAITAASNALTGAYTSPPCASEYGGLAVGGPAKHRILGSSQQPTGSGRPHLVLNHVPAALLAKTAGKKALPQQFVASRQRGVGETAK